jgi:hypothetical protein
MKCTNCGSTHDVIDFIAGKEKLVLCSGCRAKIASGQLGKVGRPSLGITKKVSLTLDQDTWDWLDEKAEGNRSQFLRETVWNALGNESEWSNYACLGYAILGAKKLGYDDEKISELVKAIYSEFDFKTVAEAEKIYTGSDY